MRVERIVVENFRCLRQATLVCTPFTALVGRNGAGKSTFLAALDKFFDPNSRVSSEDFFGCDTNIPIRIEVTFGNLRPEELDAFSHYVEASTLTVTKRFTLQSNIASATGSYFARRWRYPPFGSVRVAGKAEDMKQAFARLIVEGKIPNDAKASTKAAVTEYMDAFEKDHPELLVSIEDEAQFFGEKNVGGGKLDSFTRFVYIPAVRDVLQETGERKTSLAMLLESAVMQKLSSRSEVAELPIKVAELVRCVYNPEMLGEDLRELSTDLNRTLQSFISDASVELKWGEPRIPTFEAPPVIPSVVEDCFPGDPSHKGHGLQRALIFTLLTHRQRMQSLPPAEMSAGSVGPDLIIGIEEPELYQHPTRCRHIAGVLADLTNVTSPRTQVLYTTHSPYFVSLERFEDVRIARKALMNRPIPETTVSSATWDALRRRWAECCDIDEEKVTVQSLVSRALPSMNVVASEGYFADVTILVEGVGDASILSEVARWMGFDWSDRGIAVVPVVGKGNIGAPALILRGLSIPTYFVFDGDVRFKDKPREAHGHIVQNRILLRIAGAQPVDFPPNTVAPRFACFTDEAETYCRDALTAEVYHAVLANAAEEISWIEPDHIIKTEKGAMRFVQLVYSQGLKLPFIEEIVLAVEALAKTP